MAAIDLVSIVSVLSVTHNYITDLNRTKSINKMGPVRPMFD